MIELDGDKETLKNSNDEPVLRDIVQFVKFNTFKDQGQGKLAEEVLREIPAQLESYMIKNHIKPDLPADDDDFP